MYGTFAHVYDKFMENTPYSEWVSLIEKFWLKHGLISDIEDNIEHSKKLILELGCGTGNITNLLAKKGYDIIGIDNSQDMLTQAMQKDNNGVLYLHQDMRSFELYGTVDSIICICDGINYLTEDKEVFKVFKLVKNYLNPGGIFIFDVISKFKYEKILGNNSFSESNEESAYIWDNYYDKQTNINEYSLNFFIEDKTGLYERFYEIHYQRAYSRKKLKRMLEAAGLTLLGIYDELGLASKAQSERLFFVSINNDTQ